MTGRRGFTVVEMVLALVLGALVVSSALSVFWMLVTTDERLARKFDDQAEFLATQTAVRRAMATLVAARPRDPDPAAAATDALTAEAQRAEAERAAEEAGLSPAGSDLESLLASVTGDAGLAASLAAGATIDRPTFELFFQESGSLVLPALEVRLMESPVPPTEETLAARRMGVEQFLPVRGVFEALELDDGIAMQWRPLEPPGAPTILVRRLDAVEWYALPHKENWVDVFAAYLQEDYPDGVRLVMWSRSGAYVDWFFDTAVTTPEVE
jgi:prepilin-type N-terminal cleavage/methylation domain-containing protein